MLTLDPKDHEGKDIYKLMTGLVVPRPIAFVSTISKDGIYNLAPFSFYNAICAVPPAVCFSAAVRSGRKPGLLPHKDTLGNIRDTGEFVINVVTEDIAEAMNKTAAEVAAEVDEFALSGLTAAASDVVRAPRVAEARAAMECRLLQLVTISDQPLGGTLVIGEVVRFHVREDVVEGYRVPAEALQAVGRMSGNMYCHTTGLFELVRP